MDDVFEGAAWGGSRSARKSALGHAGNLDSAFRWFDERFADTVAMTAGAIEAAARELSENAAAVQHELVRLRQAAAELAAIRGELRERQSVPSPAASLDRCRARRQVAA